MIYSFKSKKGEQLKEAKTSLTVRISKEDKKLIHDVAFKCNKSFSEIVVDGALKEAKRIEKNQGK